MIADMYELLADPRDADITTSLVDQIANLTLTIADRANVLSQGTIVHSAPANKLKCDAVIMRTYFGVSESVINAAWQPMDLG